jgi:hypothetical protein
MRISKKESERGSREREREREGRLKAQDSRRRYLLDMFADAVRLDAAAAILRAYRPTIGVAALASRLGFGDAAEDVAEARAYVSKLGFVFDADDNVLCKDSKCDPAGLDTGEKSSLL